MSEDTFVARWESRGGKYWVELYFNPSFRLNDGRVVVDASYKGDGCGGGLEAKTQEEAINAMKARIAAGYHQADANRMPMKLVRAGSLYAAIVAAGIETGNHESDLYFPVSPESTAILTEWRATRANVTTFVHAVTGHAWYEAAFAYLPWWNAKQAIARKFEKED